MRKIMFVAYLFVKSGVPSGPPYYFDFLTLRSYLEFRNPLKKVANLLMELEVFLYQMFLTACSKFHENKHQTIMHLRNPATSGITFKLQKSQFILNMELTCVDLTMWYCYDFNLQLAQLRLSFQKRKL